MSNNHRSPCFDLVAAVNSLGRKIIDRPAVADASRANEPEPRIRHLSDGTPVEIVGPFLPPGAKP